MIHILAYQQYICHNTGHSLKAKVALLETGAQDTVVGKAEGGGDGRAGAGRTWPAEVSTETTVLRVE